MADADWWHVSVTIESHSQNWNGLMDDIWRKALKWMNMSVGKIMFLEKISIYDCQVWRLGLLRLMLCQVWRALFNGLQSSIFPVIVRQFRTVRISPGNPENTPTLPLMDSLVNFTTLHSWPPLVNGNQVLFPVKNPFKTLYIVLEVPSVVLKITKRWSSRELMLKVVGLTPGYY